MTDLCITVHGLDGLDDAMTVMANAFDPRFGEAWTAKQCVGVLSMPGAVLLIARRETPVGFALLRTVVDETELMLLAVAPKARRHGVAKALIERSLRQAVAAGSRNYFLEVRGDNPAVYLYRQKGLVQIGVRKSYYRGADGQVRDALTFKRALV